MKKLKIVILLGIIILGAVLLTGCGYGELKGIVVDKRHEEEYRTTTYMYSGKILVPINNYHPENWRVKIKKDENGKTKTTWVDVSKEEYNQIQIGDSYGK